MFANFTNEILIFASCFLTLMAFLSAHPIRCIVLLLTQAIMLATLTRESYSLNIFILLIIGVLIMVLAISSLISLSISQTPSILPWWVYLLGLLSFYLFASNQNIIPYDFFEATKEESNFYLFSLTEISTFLFALFTIFVCSIFILRTKNQD